MPLKPLPYCQVRRKLESAGFAIVSKHKQIHACIVRIDIINGKLWIQQDNTEGIAPELERYGVPKEHIVLGFRSPEIRQYTEYAVE